MKSFARLWVVIALCSLALSASAASIPASLAQPSAGTLRFVEFYSPM